MSLVKLDYKFGKDEKIGEFLGSMCMKLVVTFNLTTKFGGDENGLLQFPLSVACVAIIDLKKI